MLIICFLPIVLEMQILQIIDNQQFTKSMIFDFLWIYFNFFFQNLVISRFLEIYQREFVSLPEVYEKQKHRQPLLGVW
jgi:hypothetical protein